MLTSMDLRPRPGDGTAFRETDQVRLAVARRARATVAGVLRERSCMN